MNHKRKILSILLAALLLFAALPVTSSLASTSYLALGDSISTGYGLASPSTAGFTAILASQLGYTLDNRAVDGYTASDIYALIKDGALDAQIADAGLITVTCGGNDMMALLYKAIIEAYNAENDPDLSQDEVLAVFSGTHPTVTQYTLMSYAMTALTGFASSPEYAAGLAQYETDLTAVMNYIRAKNPDAVVILNTQYNPYDSLEGNAMFNMLYTEIEAGVVKLNDVIKSKAVSLGYTVAEVYGAFKNSSSNLCNADVTNMASPNLDFHPNAAGHALIAETILNTAFHTHSYSDASCVSPATCKCGETTGTVNPQNHTGATELRNVVAPTADSEGYSGDLHCAGCGARLAQGETVPKPEPESTAEETTEELTTEEETEPETTVESESETALDTCIDPPLIEESTKEETEEETEDEESVTDADTSAKDEGCGLMLGATASVFVMALTASVVVALKKRDEE